MANKRYVTLIARRISEWHVTLAVSVRHAHAQQVGQRCPCRPVAPFFPLASRTHSRRQDCKTTIASKYANHSAQISLLVQGQTVDRTPNLTMSDSLYASCAEVLSLAQSQKEDLFALLDPDNGFAPKLRQICQDQLLEAEENADGRYPIEELEALRMESDTWGLLQAVMP